MSRCSHPLNERVFLEDRLEDGKWYKVYQCRQCGKEFWLLKTRKGKK